MRSFHHMGYDMGHNNLKTYIAYKIYKDSILTPKFLFFTLSNFVHQHREDSTNTGWMFKNIERLLNIHACE